MSVNGEVSSSESSWPDEVWLDPIRDHVKRRAQWDPSADDGLSAYGGSTISGSSIDQVRNDIRNLRFYINGSDESGNVTPVPLKQMRANHIREERRWARLYKVLNEEVQRKLISLRLKINALADYACLPTEILCQIFLLVAADPTNKSHVPVLTLTQVCRHWRKVAIATPMLWTSIWPTMSVRDVARSLRRSNGLALDFTISGTQGSANHWEYFHEHIGRCKRITIKDIPPEWIADLQPWLDNPAPLLEELVLSAVPSQSPISADLDLSFFDQNTPLLKKVRLDTIILPRSSFHLLLNITHLEFAFGHGPKTGCQIPSHRYILDLLACAPLLEDAVIERYGTEHQPYFRTFPQNYKVEMVKLQHLKRLAVQGLAPIELLWLEFLDIPMSCCVKIGIDLAHHNNIAPLLAVLENPSGGLRPLLRVQETMFTGSSGSTSDKDKLGIHLWDPDSQLAFAIVFRSPQSREQVELLIWLLSVTLFKRYTPRCLAWSNMSSKFIIGPGIYIRILMDRPTITDLAFDDCAFVADALRLLTASGLASPTATTPPATGRSGTGTPTGADASASDMLCPNLAYLAISRCRSLPGPVVLDLARGRDLRGKTLRKLRIRNCDAVGRRAVSDMRWLVEDLEWDGELDWDGFSTMADLDPEEVLWLDDNDDNEGPIEVEPTSGDDEEGKEEVEVEEKAPPIPTKLLAGLKLGPGANDSVETITSVGLGSTGPPPVPKKDRDTVSREGTVVRTRKDSTSRDTGSREGTVIRTRKDSTSAIGRRESTATARNSINVKRDSTATIPAAISIRERTSAAAMSRRESTGGITRPQSAGKLARTESTGAITGTRRERESAVSREREKPTRRSTGDTETHARWTARRGASLDRRSSLDIK
ncbi:hypothetical protein PIIN_08750 [Serendipita indica DSM 11827]|uniref:F-box domain-containing protein n=1 Tax=Serendipita indica (strain DSM 11827) TaxID=1109443 RepID=G4TTY8_SERID|nr:hypothetical protein PIIN_08750 [Serendipita indica DSM 11827]